MVEEVSRLLRPADKGHHTLSLLRLFERERQQSRPRGEIGASSTRRVLKRTSTLPAVYLARRPWILCAAPSSRASYRTSRF